jgi:hypothetical protein
MPRPAVVWICTALLLAPQARPARAVAAETRDAGLERGIRKVEAGEWTEALKHLSEAARRLSRDPSRKSEAAQAFLYAGLAYVGLGDTSPAISQFAEAVRRNPRIAIPAERDSQAARDAFEVARREAEAGPAPKTGGKSKAPFVVAGVAAAGAGVALAAGGGSASNDPSASIPKTFTVTGSTGTPQLRLLSAVPPSASTIHLARSGPTLAFAFNNEPGLPARVQIQAEMSGPSGACIVGVSDVLTVDPRAASFGLDINSWTYSCQVGFVTVSMNVRLFDADGHSPVSQASYSGGYLFVN